MVVIRDELNEVVFTPSETTTILELARIALADAEIFDKVAGDLDVRDEDMKQLQEQIKKVMEVE